MGQQLSGYPMALHEFVPEGHWKSRLSNGDRFQNGSGRCLGDFGRVLLLCKGAHGRNRCEADVFVHESKL